MDASEVDEIDANTSKTTEVRVTKKKSAPKLTDTGVDKTGKTTEKKRKAPKAPTSTDVNEYEPIYESNGDKTLEKENDIQVSSTLDQEVPIKPKKKKAPKAETTIDNVDSTAADTTVKKKKAKAPKIVVADDDFQISEDALMDTLEAVPESRLKVKSKKSKSASQANREPLDDIQGTNLDDAYLAPSELNINNIENGAILNGEDAALFDNNASEYERTLLDCFGQLAAQVNFTEFFNDDQWCIKYLPKSARTEPKSRIRKMLQVGNNNKDDRLNPKKPTGPKPSLFTRLRAGVSTLVRDENNMIFGEPSPYDLVDDEDEDDDVDTDNLHRYAQQLRELEDKDREVNPEYLVLRDGKTVYGVHESDADGKVKLSTRKPIYDRFADQAPDEQSEKRKLLSRLKLPFTRNRDNGKDAKSPKSSNATPSSRASRKTNGKALDNDETVPEVQ